MERSKRPHASRRTWAQHALSLAWGAWAELGVSGWGRTHGAWAIDPEPLIFLTAGLGDRDPRLRDEAADWCIRNWRLVSRVRLRNLLRDQSDDVLRAYGEFAATVNEHAGLSWPGATEPWEHFRVTGRSTLRPLEQPALLCLRTRAMFGVSARAEILRHMLGQRNAGLSVARLAELVGYAKRNVAEECDMLESAGLLTHRTEGNRFIYAPARRAELGAFVGEVPEIFPNWSALSSVVLALLALAEAEGGLSRDAFVVEVHGTLHDVHEALEELGFDGPPRQSPGPALWPELKRWADGLLAELAHGRWPGSAPRQELPPVSTRALRRRP